MAKHTAITIDHTEKFEHLPHAPIVEAVIQLVARTEVPQKSDDFEQVLKKELPEFQTIRPMASVSVTLALEETSEGSPSPPTEQPKPERARYGFRLESEDNRHIAMFTRDYFSFSQLKPYDSWETFQTEALRIWAIHEKLTGPTEIKRIGVRFINRLEVPSANLNPGDYLKGLPESPGDFPRFGFVYRDDLVVSEYPYRVKLIRTVQPSDPSTPERVALLLDIDVHSTEPFAPKLARIKEKLADMHWIKNQAFFNNVSDTALNLCR